MKNRFFLLSFLVLGVFSILFGFACVNHGVDSRSTVGLEFVNEYGQIINELNLDKNIGEVVRVQTVPRNAIDGNFTIELVAEGEGENIEDFAFDSETGIVVGSKYGAKAHIKATLVGKKSVNSSLILKVESQPEALTGSISFSSAAPFTLRMGNKSVNWGKTVNSEFVPGQIEYSFDNENWITGNSQNIWDGNTLFANVKSNGLDSSKERYYLYLRGTGNEFISHSISAADNKYFVITTSDEGNNDVVLNGDMRNLLDYNAVLQEQEIVLGEQAFSLLFYNCAAIKSLGNDFVLPFTSLSASCYRAMFRACTNLVSLSPNFRLNAPVLTDSCYMFMFSQCYNLKSLPDGFRLDAETVSSCYNNMFSNCQSLSELPAGFSLPASNAAFFSCCGMFSNCYSLTKLPDGFTLAATTLGGNCYDQMFSNCRELTSLPDSFDLPATALQGTCYQAMFNNCAKLRFSSENTGDFANAKSFTIGSTGGNASSLANMFKGTNKDENLPDTPEKGTVAYFL